MATIASARRTTWRSVRRATSGSGAPTLFECVELVHDALPDMKLSDIDLSITVLGKTLRAPLVIAAMTGGTDQAGRINRELASIAEERGYGFGLGSQRAMHVRARRWRHLPSARRRAETAGPRQHRRRAGPRDGDERGARARRRGRRRRALHPPEPGDGAVQPGGDRDFAGGLDTIQRLGRDLGVPVVVKETGCGISPPGPRRLRGAGVQHVDVSGAGGTSWVAVETERAQRRATPAERSARRSGDWGVPTAASVALPAPPGFETIIATGGVASGLDAAGHRPRGSAAGIARPVLQAFMTAGEDGAIALPRGGGERDPRRDAPRRRARTRRPP